MDLQDFVSQSLIQITRGINAAQQDVSPIGAMINPAMKALLKKGEGDFGAFGWAKHGGPPVLMVEFDVAVTAAKGKHTKGGIGVVTGILALGSQGASDHTDSSISRLKFSVPVQFPAHEPKSDAP